MSVARKLKQSLLTCFLFPGFPNLLRYVQRDCATVFMLHRFNDEERGIVGCETAHLRNVLSYLTTNGYEFVSLVDLFDRLGGRGAQLRGAVAFTMDDGYVDQATIAAPVFSEFDCPVTTFVTTGFLDGQLWLWWDRIDYVFRYTERRSVQIPLGDTVLDYRWRSGEERARAQVDFTAKCKYVPEEEKQAAIACLAQAAEVDVPRDPPRNCMPMSWKQVRRCEEMGMTFGPHTVTHPVLSRTTEDAAEHEIVESWARLQTEVRNPVPVFCYPNGKWLDFGGREIALLQRLGLTGAVVAEPGYANASAFRAGESEPFKVQRFGLPDDFPHVIQCVSGVERIKQLLRGGA